MIFHYVPYVVAVVVAVVTPAPPLVLVLDSPSVRLHVGALQIVDHPSVG